MRNPTPSKIIPRVANGQKPQPVAAAASKSSINKSPAYLAGLVSRRPTFQARIRGRRGSSSKRTGFRLRCTNCSERRLYKTGRIQALPGFGAGSFEVYIRGVQLLGERGLPVPYLSHLGFESPRAKAPLQMALACMRICGGRAKEWLGTWV